MGMRAGERGAVMIREWVKVLFLALALLVATTGCGEEEQLSAPTTDDFVKERQALAARQKSAPTALANSMRGFETSKATILPAPAALARAMAASPMEPAPKRDTK